MPDAGLDEQSMIREQLYVDGTWTRPAGTDATLTLNSANGEPVGQFPTAEQEDVDRAVAAARRALSGRHDWAQMLVDDRAALINHLATAIENREDVLGPLIAQEVGTPIKRATANNVAAAAGLLRFYAQVASEAPLEDVRPASTGSSVVRREPVGVVAMVTPWNYPLSTLFFKLAPALAAGCTAVIKPAPETGLDSFFIADALDEVGVPPGVVNVVPGGRDTGEYLVTHPDIDKVAFTGSTAAGRRIGRLCGEQLTPLTLELGGKSAALLLEDAPLELFLTHLHELCFANNGQTCTNNTRILVPESCYTEVVDAVTEQVRGWTVGDPLDPHTVTGPLCSATHRDRVESYYEIGRREGARVTVGGGRPARQPQGFFVEPTVFADVTPSMRVFREEIFGPAVSITSYSGDPHEGAELANDSEYGLSGAVFTDDEQYGVDLARSFDVGTVNVNQSSFEIGAPFGGRKASGVGSELGAEGIRAYQHLKSMFVPAR